MGIIFFILIAGAWAAFLLPSFLDHRRGSNPSETTKEFAVSKARLGALAGSDEPLANEYHAAHNAQVRRQRVFIVLVALAVLTLVAAVLTSSLIWLGLSIVVDVLIGTYVTLLLYIRQQSQRQRTVVKLDAAPRAPTEAEDLDFDAAPPSVRIIGG